MTNVTITNDAELDYTEFFGHYEEDEDVQPRKDTEYLPITRRSRFQACISHSQGFVDVEQCETYTVSQFLTTLENMRRGNPNAFIFVTLYRQGKRCHYEGHHMKDLFAGYDDELWLEVAQDS